AWSCAALIVVCCGLTSGCAKPTAPPEQATQKLPTDDELRDRIDKALAFTYANRHLSTEDQAAWQIVHGTLVYGKEVQIYHAGKLAPALDYLVEGDELRGWTMRKGDHVLKAIVEAGSKTGQGHEDQWLGYLSQCGLPTDPKIVVAREPY